VTEREIRVEMQPRWKAAQMRFIDMTGGEMGATPQSHPRAFAERKRAEDALLREYHELRWHVARDNAVDAV
jgi:hypothetical protein